MELESVASDGKKMKNLMLTSCEKKEHKSEGEDPMSLLVRRFDRALRKVEQGQGQRRFMLAEEDFEEDSEDEEVVNNFVSCVGIIEVEDGNSGSEYDGDHEDELVESYKEVRETLIILGHENLALITEKQRLEALVETLQTELQAERILSQESVLLLKEKLNLAVKAVNLEKELRAEKKISTELQSQLDLQYKKIRMFAGTRQLDKFLSYGRTEGVHRGLGYTGRDVSESKDIKFVATSVPSHPIRRTEGTVVQRTGVITAHKTGCYFCGRHGHIRAFCYKYWERIRRLRYEGKFNWKGYRNQIWVRKSDLRSSTARRVSDNPSGVGFQLHDRVVHMENEQEQPVARSREQQTGTEGQTGSEEQSVTEEESNTEQNIELHVPRNHSASDLISDVNEGRKTKGAKKDYRRAEYVLRAVCYINFCVPLPHKNVLQCSEEFSNFPPDLCHWFKMIDLIGKKAKAEILLCLSRLHQVLKQMLVRHKAKKGEIEDATVVLVTCSWREVLQAVVRAD
ncbi:unnamed protein product [Arabis nemorensis]|uniref:CCHC-type domain-containing protein n=1 Tax=Arabis nemorensis TaxID=586526 RepID=A0A565CCE2_9BRAS|nr:unnamed protein product [Arabis nemorensis]